MLTVGSIVQSIPFRCSNTSFEDVIKGRWNDVGFCVFNEELIPWNYNWASHKYKSSQKHCLYIIVAVDNENI